MGDDGANDFKIFPILKNVINEFTISYTKTKSN